MKQKISSLIRSARDISLTVRGDSHYIISRKNASEPLADVNVKSDFSITAFAAIAALSAVTLFSVLHTIFR